MAHKFDRRAFRKSLWSSISRLIGVSLGAGAGSLLYKLVGHGLQGWSTALLLMLVSVVLMVIAEYEREIG
jgi:predicted MFS family arabinose efflux permease